MVMNTMMRLGMFWGLGAGMFLLRLGQNTHDFDPSTGLYLGGSSGLALGVLAVAALLLSLLLSLRAKKDRPLFADYFCAPEKSTTVLVAAAFLFAGGGMLTGLGAFSAELRVAPLITAVLAFISFVCVLLLTRRMRTERAVSVAPVLPLMFFAAFWVLTLYLPAANDPILARYWLPVLAAAVSAYAFAQLAGFFRKETKVRTFRFVAGYAVTLCIAAVAELNNHSLFFAACALLLSVFLALDEKKIIETESAES